MEKRTGHRLEFFSVDTASSLELPYANHGIQAGFPSPAQDYLEESIDLNRILVKNAPSTFYARVRGDSLIEDGITEGDILVIDKSLKPMQGDLVVAVIDNEFTLKYIDIRDDGIFLVPANRNFEPIRVDENDSFMIWGVVTYTIKKHRMKK